MGQIRKIGDVYYIEFYARGLLYSQVAGSNLEDAQKLLEKTEATIAGGEALTIVRHIDLLDFFNRYIQDISQQYSSRTVRRYRQAIEHFNGYIQKSFPQIQQLASVTPVVVESYKQHLIKITRPKVTNFTLLLLRDVLEFGIKLGFLNDNPTLHVRLLPWPIIKHKTTPRFQSAQQLFSKGIGLGKAAQLLNISDVGRIIYYANLIPLNREDMYN